MTADTQVHTLHLPPSVSGFEPLRAFRTYAAVNLTTAGVDTAAEIEIYDSFGRRPRRACWRPTLTMSATILSSTCASAATWPRRPSPYLTVIVTACFVSVISFAEKSEMK